MARHAQYCFMIISGLFPALRKNVRALDCVSRSNIFLCAGNNPVVLKNSTDHVEPLFIALLDLKCCVRTFNQHVSYNNVTQYALRFYEFSQSMFVEC